MKKYKMSFFFIGFAFLLSRCGGTFDDVSKYSKLNALDPGVVTKLINCPNDPTNKTNTDIIVEGTNLKAFSYKIFLSGQDSTTSWSAPLDNKTPIQLDNQTINQDGIWTIKARGINAADKWQDESSAVHCSWRLDTMIDSVGTSQLNPVSGGDNPVTTATADANLANILIIDTDGSTTGGAGSTTAATSNSGSTANNNNTGQIILYDGNDDDTTNPSDYTQAMYLVLDSSGNPVDGTNWSMPITLSPEGTVIPPTALADGEYTVLILLGDAAGNWVCTPATVADCRDEAVSRPIVVDKTPPSVSGDVALGGLPPTTTDSRDINISLTAQTDSNGNPLATGGTDIVEYRYQLDGGTSSCVGTVVDGWCVVSSLSTPITASDLTSEQHSIVIQIKDAANNWSPSYPYTWLVAIYTVSGNTTGYAATIKIKNTYTVNGSFQSEIFTLTGDGSFTLVNKLSNNAEYNVTIEEKPSNLVCQVRGGEGRVSEANVTEIEITCLNNDPATASSLTTCPANPTNSSSAEILVGGTNLVYYSYKAYFEGTESTTSWSGRIPKDTKIELSSQTLHKDGIWHIKARGINAADAWQEEGTAVHCSWKLDTTIASVESSQLNPGTVGDQSVSNAEADTNLENIVIIDMDGNTAGGSGNSTPVDSDPSSNNNINNNGQIVIFDGNDNDVTDPSDYTQVKYLVLDSNNNPVPVDANWSSAIALNDTGTQIPASPLADGTYTILLILGDAADNWTCSPATAADCRDSAVRRTIVVDKTSPVISASGGDVSVSGLPPAVTNNTSANIVLTPNLDANGKPAYTGGTTLIGYSYSTDNGSTWSLYTSGFAASISLSGLSTGSQNLKIKVKDLAGNESDVFSYIWTIDTNALVATLSGTPANPSNTVFFDVTVGCAYSGWDQYRYKIVDDATCGDTGYITVTDAGTKITAETIAANSQGIRTLCVLAGDADTSSWQDSTEDKITKYSFMADRKAPDGNSLITVTGGLMPALNSTINKTNVTSIRAGSTNDIIFTVGADTGAAITHYQYRVSKDGGSSWTDYTNGGAGYALGAAIDLNNADLPDSGDYTLKVEIVLKDAAGNWGAFGADGKILTYMIDQTPPELPTGIVFGGTGTADPGSACAGEGSALYVNPLNSQYICGYNIGRVDFDDDLTISYTKPVSWSQPNEDVTIEFTLATSPYYKYNGGSPQGYTPGVAPYGKTFTQSMSGEPDNYTFNDVNEDGVSYYIKLRVKDAVGNWSEFRYGGDLTYFDENYNIESVSLLKAIVKDAAYGTPINGVYVSLYDPAGNCLGALPTGGTFGDGRVQALVRKGDNYFTGKVVDLSAGQCNMSSSFTLSGYEPAIKNSITSKPGQINEYPLLLSPLGGTAEEKIIGEVVDANDANGVTNANIKLYKWDGTLVKARWCDTSDPDYSAAGSPTLSSDCGNANFAADASTGPVTGDIPSGTYTGKIYKNGYFQIVVDNMVINGANTGANPLDLGRIALCGVLVEPHVRVIVQWGTSPRDLDLHLVGPTNKSVSPNPTNRFHIYYSRKNFNENTGTYPSGAGDVTGTTTTASLVQDKTTSYGPEAINLYGLGSGYAYGNYNFSLFNYTNRYQTDPDNMGWYTYPVTARVYDSEGMVMEIPMPEGANANDTWRMFTVQINGVGRLNRKIIMRNEFVDRTSSFSTKSSMDW